MKRAYLLIGAVVVVVLVAAFGFWWTTTFKRVPLEVDLPMRGEARYNPLYALKKTLQAQQIEVISRSGVNFAAMDLQPGDTLLLDIDVRNVSEDQAGILLEWMEGGGHLVFPLPPGGEGRAALLELLGLSASSHSDCVSWTQASADDSGKYCSNVRFHVADDGETQFDWLWGNASDGFVFGRQRWGEGSVFVAADLDFLDNRSLDEAGNAALAWQVLGPVLGEGRVFLIYSADIPPLYVLIVQRGWPLLVPLALALLAWLWARSERLGPLLPLASTHRRALLAHVHAAGEFAFARGRFVALHAAVLRAFQARLRRRDPITAALGDEALVLALSERHQIGAAQVRQALHPVELGRPDHFLATIRTLMQLRAKT